MAKVSINEEYIVNGVLTVTRYVDENNSIVVAGSFATHYYFEEIKSIETYRYKITGVEVSEENFGADNFDIVYNFKAKEIEIKNNMTNLSTEEIEEIEKEIYGRDGYVLGTVIEKENEFNTIIENEVNKEEE